MGEVKNFIEDKSNQDLVNSGVFDKIDGTNKTLDKDTENAINEKVEKSFQEFLKKNKDKFDNTDDSLKQSVFNGWLDENVNGILEDAKLKEIEIINPDIKQKLAGLYFKINLSAYQEELQNQKDQTANTASMEIGNIELNLKLYNGIDKNDVISLFKNKNFERKNDLLNLLKGGTQNDVKNFQRIIAGIAENGNEDLQAKGNNKVLGKFGVDGKFGSETLDAFKTYINSKEIVGTPSAGQEGNSSNTPAGQQIDAQGHGTLNNGNQSPTTGGLNNPNGANNHESNGTISTNSSIESNTGSSNSPEILDRDHGIKSLYEDEAGKEITIATLKNGETISVVPTILAENISIENGKFILPDNEWEGTVSIKLKDNIGTEKSYTITIKSKESQKLQGKEKSVDRFEEDIKNLQKQYLAEKRKIIPNLINEIKKEYNELKSSNKNDPANEIRKKELESDMKKIIEARIENDIEYAISTIKNSDKENISCKNILEKNISDDAIIYIDGKYLTKGEFLSKKRNKTVKNVSKVNYKNVEINLNEDFRNSNDSERIKITHMVLSDVEDFGKRDIAGDQEIQYDAYLYAENDVVDNGFSGKDKDRKAIRKLIKGLDEALSIVDIDYKNKSGERRMLSKLKYGLISLVNSKKNISEVFGFIAEKYSNGVIGDKKRWKEIMKGKYNDLNSCRVDRFANLGELYSIYKQDQDGNNLGAYFKRVMGLLENYFVRGVDNVAKISEMYNKERIGVVKGLIDPDKQRKAIRSLFKEGNEIGGVSYSPSPELKELQKLVKDIDFVNFFEKPGVASYAENMKPEGLNSKELKFYEKYQIYVENLHDNNLEENKNKHPIVVNGNDYYNAVFDFLVGIGEARSDIVSAVNSLKLYDGEIDPELAEKSGFRDGAEMRLVCMLSDLNSDGRADFADKNFKMGLEIKDIYKDALVDKKYGVIKREPLQNLIEFAKRYADKNKDVSIKRKLDNIENYESENLLENFKTNPDVLKYLQTMLANSPSNFVENIFKYGAPDKQENEDAETKKQVELIEETAVKVAIEQILNNEKFNETFEREYQKLVAQGVEDSPEARAKFRPIVAAGIFQKFTENTTDKNLLLSFGIGGVLETEKCGDFALMLGVIVGNDGSKSVGVSLGRGNSWKVSEKTAIGVAVNTSGQCDFENGISLGASVTIGASSKLNDKQIMNSLKPVSAKKLSYGVTGGVGFNLKEGAIGVSVGGYLAYSRDKKEGIDSGYDNIKNKLGGENGLLTQILSDVNFDETENQIKDDISQKLEDTFYKNKNKTEQDKNSLEKATNNIYRALSYYMVSFNVKDNITDENQKKQVMLGIANNITELYATQWRNEAVKNLEKKGWRIDGVGLGMMILLLPLPIPIPVLGVSFTNYKGVYSHETVASRDAYNRQLLTEGNIREVAFYDENGYTQEGINYLNEKLQIANGRVKVPKIKLNDNTNAETGSNTQTNIKGKRTIFLPNDLYKYVNINIKSNLGNYVQKSDDWIEVPANTDITLLTSHETSTGKFNLIIGGTSASENDILINSETNLSGNAKYYEGQSEFKLDIDAVNNSLKTNITAKDFPIENCVLCEKINGDQYAKFEIKKGMKIKDMGSEYSKSRVIDNFVYVPITGTMTIYKPEQGDEYQLYYQSNPDDNLKINYEEEGKIKFSNEPKQKKEHNVELSTNDVLYGENFVNQLNNVMKKLNNSDVHNLIFEYNTDNRNDYVNFMDYSCQNNYKNAFNSLKLMVNDNGNGRNQIYTNLLGLRSFINGLQYCENNKNKIMMVVDQCKMFFSYEKNLTDGRNDYQNLKTLISRRRDIYENLNGYDKTTTFPLKGKKYREKVVEKLKGKTDLRSNPLGNLIGMTAFYKKNLKEGGRGYSMTTLGNTTPLGGYMEPIAASELESTKEWFRNNLDKTELHKNVIKTSIENIIKTSLKDKFDEMSLKALELDDNNLKELLMGRDIDLTIGKDIIKVNLDVEYVFYLLQECANESIGIQLSQLNIQYNDTIIEAIPDQSDPTKMTTTENLGKNYYTSRMRTKSAESENQLDISKKKQFSTVISGGVIKDHEGGTTEVDPDRDIPGTTEVVPDRPH